MDELIVPSLASALRAALTDHSARFEVMKALGWDNTQANKFLGGKMGITEMKLDRVAAALGVVIVRPELLDGVIKLSRIGAAEIDRGWAKTWGSVNAEQMKKAS